MANPQTISEFLFRPFGARDTNLKDQEYAAAYSKYLSQKKIYIQAYCEIGESYYYHIKIPSESKKDKDYAYDVVIRFYTDKVNEMTTSSIAGYYVQFFSNSPSFIYQYAYVYKQEGFLIEALYDKLDPEYIDVAPTKTNPNMKRGYDRSIYMAARYLADGKFKYLTKTSMRGKKVSDTKFFSGVSDILSVRADQLIIKEEKKLQENLEKIKKQKEEKERPNTKAAKKTSGLSTMKTGVIKKIAKKPKIRPKRSTKR